jgi:hypothetical protein
MLRHLLPFIPSVETARDLRTLIEEDTTIVICGPDRAVALRFLALVCGHRQPDAHRVALLPLADKDAVALDAYRDFTQLAVSDDRSFQDGLRAALRIDADGFVFADFPDSALELLFSALCTGHTIGTAIVSRHGSIDSTLAAWKAAHPGMALVLQGTRGMPPLLFIELFADGHRPLLRSVAIPGGEAADGVIRRYHWNDFPFVPGRDEDLHSRYRRHAGAAYAFHLVSGEPRTDAATAPEHLVTAAGVKAWKEQAGAAPAGAKAALVPICTPLTEERKLAVIGAMESAAWPRSPAGKPAFLVAAFTVPSGGCGPLAAGQRFHLICDDMDGGTDDAYRVVVTTAADSPVAGDLLREHYLVREWMPISDRPMGDDDAAETCYGGNKLLGDPRWAQGEEVPACPICQRSMALFLQLDGEGGEMQNLWGDAMLFVFHCPDHPGTWKTLQQYS